MCNVGISFTDVAGNDQKNRAVMLDTLTVGKFSELLALLGDRGMQRAVQSEPTGTSSQRGIRS